ncbi:MAG: ABC-2 transporter permease [Sedimentisphaerales bacterium]|nr:ABC-2 transporter permease [Sedimentisphaerales bacterium]
MFLMLLWKEWKENLWKLGFCGAASIAFTIMLFRMRIIPDVENCFLISLAQMFIVPVVYSLDIFSGEISNRTIHLLFKIPVKRWIIFFSKYLVSAAGIIFIFLASSLLMELMARGREASVYFLMRTNLLYGLAGLLLFTWFCPFGCQSRSEAGSLVVMFAVFIGWGIVLLWSGVCEVTWAERFVPYSFLLLTMEMTKLKFTGLVFSQIIAFAAVLAVACYRFVSIRRYL